MPNENHVNMQSKLVQHVNKLNRSVSSLQSKVIGLQRINKSLISAISNVQPINGFNDEMYSAVQDAVKEMQKLESKLYATP